MERGVKTNNQDKAWVTVTYNANLGDFEGIKMEIGFSQTLETHDDPIQVIHEMEKRLSPEVINRVEILRTQLSDKIPRTNELRRRHKD